jgi:hypothetical protein
LTSCLVDLFFATKINAGGYCLLCFGIKNGNAGG